MAKPVIVVHGGAWGIPDEQVDENIKGVEKAVREGWKILKTGGSALDAVVAAVNSMEDNPIFDAGIGSVLTTDGTVEMDALIMDGNTLNAGAVAGLRDVRYPIKLARHVMEDTPHVLMIGDGANRLADEFKVERITQDELVTEDARKGLKEWLKDQKFGETFGHETVGAVALDADGNIATATSTGGVTGKRVGRVGDVPIIGSGGYADNRVGAVSTTGHGESILKVNLSKLVLNYMETGMSVQIATEKALGYMAVRVNGNGGLIAIDKDGNIGHGFTTKRMVWASIKDDDLESGINA
ncbi:MAG: isoaspartyl peptidase/L-asparaginase [Candidatus Bathyarchaeota archaeon]|nr:isoaspartyl peptidase/L-asparaginase [Candidatus Bathyarchaeota archaeon]